MTLGLNDEVPVVICVDGAVGDGRGEGLVASEDMGKTFLVLGSWFLVHRGFLRELRVLRGGRLRLNCLTTNGTNHTNESKLNTKIRFSCVCLCALSVRRGEHCDLFFTTEGTEFTEKAETQSRQYSVGRGTGKGGVACLVQSAIRFAMSRTIASF